MTALLDVRHLSKHYPGRRGDRIIAVDDVSFTLADGEVLGIVGESGCGKSTLGRTVLRLTEPTAGAILFEGDDLATLPARAMARRRRDLQIVFQDPFGSLNPRHKVSTIIGEPLVIHGEPDIAERVRDLIAMVGLPSDAGTRFPHEFSGGQRQRIAIARALALKPKLLVADEPVSALDVSIQSQIINLIADLRRDLGLAMIFISHDLSVVRHVSDRIGVMYLGHLVEIGAAAELFAAPAHPYAQALLSALPQPYGAAKHERITLQGELPDPAAPPPGCVFHARCPHAFTPCFTERPATLPRRLTDGTEREIACHLYQTA